MTLVRVQMTFERDTLIPADRTVNTLYYGSAMGDFLVPADADTLADAVIAAYDQITPRMASTLNGAGSCSVYDMRHPEPRVPLVEVPFTGKTMGTGALPAEVAICLSFRGDIVSGENQARRRGRIFVGPLDAGGVSVTGGAARPIAGLVTDLGDLAQALYDAGSLVGNPLEHVVFSPTDAVGAALPEDAMTPVRRYWVDNAFDTQRRRGVAPTARTEIVPA